MCEAHAASGDVTYTWTSTNRNSFVSGKTGKNVTTAKLTSNDSGLHKCCVTDANGNTGCAETEMIIKGTERLHAVLLTNILK